ncbi:MAG: TetR/AcrR family transcriptional regulator [Lachnospiraceae bacterium]|nr:TetR/AcrR family transcriptional regulator [Lachnospiraceae bacterium]
MEKFYALPEEKKQSIINAALQCFGRYGYEKTSIQDIAEAAHISKASVFQYFGSKKQLYQFLLEYCKGITMEMFDREALDEEADLFERILASARMKAETLKRQPFLTQFIAGAWEEDSEEVRDVLAALMDESGQFREELVLRETDAVRFKNPEDVEPVFRMLILMAEGYAAHYRSREAFDFDTVVSEFETYIAVLRNNFYKEEYLV